MSTIAGNYQEFKIQNFIISEFPFYTEFVNNCGKFQKLQGVAFV